MNTASLGMPGIRGLNRQAVSTALAFLGDFCPSCEYTRKPELVAERLRSARRTVPDASLLFVNLECCVTAVHTRKTTEVPIESTDHLEILKPVVANVANNHFFDTGAMPIPTVLQRLSERGVKVVGIYPETGPFWDVFVAERRTIGVISRVARGTHPQAWKRDGLSMLPLERTEVLSVVNRLRPQVDILILSLHWGAEYYSTPSPWQKRLACDLCDAGVDVVWGHHAHRRQPSAMRKHTLLLYNQGNFLFGADSGGRWPKESDAATLVEWSEPEGLAQEWLVATRPDGSRAFGPGAAIRTSASRVTPLSIDCLVWLLIRLYREVLLYGYRFLWRRVTSQNAARAMGEASTPSSRSRGVWAVLASRVRRVFDLKADE